MTTPLKIGPQIIPGDDELTANLQEAEQVSLANLGNGTFAQVFSTNSGPGVVELFNMDGTVAAAPIIVSGGPVENITVTTLTNGHFVVAWDDGVVHAQLYDQHGHTIGTQFVASTPEVTDGGGQSDPSVIALANGAFAIGYDDTSAQFQSGPDAFYQTDLDLQFFNANGTKNGSSFNPPATHEFIQTSMTGALLSDGRAVVAWLDGENKDGFSQYRIHAAIYNANGSVSVAEFVAGGDNIPGSPSVAALGDDRFVVTWWDTVMNQSQDIIARVFKGDGTPVTGEFTVNSTTANAQNEQQVTALSNGEFVVVWQSTDVHDVTNDIYTTSIRGQMFHAGGVADGGEFVVASETSNNSNAQFAVTYPSITALDDGSFVVAWNDQDGHIHDQLYATTRLITGTGASQTITGNANDNVINGLGGDDIVNGGAGADTIDGGAGDDVLTGGAGADVLYGNAGNDTYIVRDTLDRVIEAVGGGDDKIETAVSYTLLAGQEIETLATLKTSGTQAIDLAGNEFANTLNGNAGANTLNGGLGNDLLKGQGGRDTYVFDTALNADTNVDKIVGFTSSKHGASAESDVIALDQTVFHTLPKGVLAAKYFTTGAPATADQHILYHAADGTLSYDADGSGAGEAVVFAVVAGHPALFAGDFLVT